MIVQVVQEPAQDPLSAVELVTQCTAHRQVVGDQAPQVLEFLRPGGHDAPPPIEAVGHGRVSVDSLTWSVLAQIAVVAGLACRSRCATCSRLAPALRVRLAAVRRNRCAWTVPYPARCAARATMQLTFERSKAVWGVLGPSRTRSAPSRRAGRRAGSPRPLGRRRPAAAAGRSSCPCRGSSVSRPASPRLPAAAQRVPLSEDPAGAASCSPRSRGVPPRSTGRRRPARR